MAILYTAARDATENRYEGAVLRKIVQHDYRIMSDIWGTADWALVWDEASASPKQVLVNVYDMNPSGWCPVAIEEDATSDVRAKYLKWKTERFYESLLGDAEIRVREIVKGAIVKVVKGRNGKGTVGPVVVAMNAIYGMGWRSSQRLKVAIATSDVKVKKALRNGKVAEVYRDVVWTWAHNVVREDIAEIDKEALLQQAQERAVRAIAA